MANNLTKLQRSTAILNESKVTEWKYVDTNNEFTFMSKVFKIDECLDDYKVYNKAGLVEDFTNEAYMEQILISLGNDGSLRFYNQNYEEINSGLVNVKE